MLLSFLIVLVRGADYVQWQLSLRKAFQQASGYLIRCESQYVFGPVHIDASAISITLHVMHSQQYLRCLTAPSVCVLCCFCVTTSRSVCESCRPESCRLLGSSRAKTYWVVLTSGATTIVIWLNRNHNTQARLLVSAAMPSHMVAPASILATVQVSPINVDSLV